MLFVIPLIIQTAFNVAIQASVFLNMVEDTMPTEGSWNQSKRDKYGLLALVGIGVGEVAGAILYGRI